MKIYAIFTSLFFSLMAFSDLNNIFLEVSRDGNIKVVRQALEQSTNIEAKDELRATALLRWASALKLYGSGYSSYRKR